MRPRWSSAVRVTPGVCDVFVDCCGGSLSFETLTMFAADVAGMSGVEFKKRKRNCRQWEEYVVVVVVAAKSNQ